ncbi:peptidylprolyl isomerase [Candidatus Woesearchaeota archaeon]|nr:peptidylprolyl isomerase [Candidatus Woesearchaeota archaeon]
MPAKKGDKVKIDYTGTLDDGTVFDSSTHGDHSHPIEFVMGEGKVIPGFENAVYGMEKGEEKQIKILPKDAYGDAKPDMVRKIPKDVLPKDKEIKAGMMLMIAAPNGMQFPARVTAVDEKEVTLDMNHPLAGKTLNFKIKLVDVQ